MRAYKIYLSILPLLVTAAQPLLFLVVAPIIIIAVGPPVPPFMIAFPMFAGVVAAYYYWVSVAYEIRVNENGPIEFRSLLRRVTLMPQEIQSIKANSHSLGWLIKVRHRRGAILLLHQMDGFHEFLTNLKAVNPSVEIKGC